MSETLYDGIVAMLDNIDLHIEVVEEQMRKAGMEECDPALSASIAKYWDALERLAAE